MIATAGCGVSVVSWLGSRLLRHQHHVAFSSRNVGLDAVPPHNPHGLDHRYVVVFVVVVPLTNIALIVAAPSRRLQAGIPEEEEAVVVEGRWVEETVHPLRHLPRSPRDRPVFDSETAPVAVSLLGVTHRGAFS